jgi:DNA-binding protein HU-beta
MSNSVTKADLVSAIASETGLKRAEAEAALVAATNAIQAALAQGQKVTLVGFGTFSVAERKEKQGRDPQSKEPITIPAHKAVKFAAGRALKDLVNK